MAGFEFWKLSQLFLSLHANEERKKREFCSLNFTLPSIVASFHLVTAETNILLFDPSIQLEFIQWFNCQNDALCKRCRKKLSQSLGHNCPDGWIWAVCSRKMACKHIYACRLTVRNEEMTQSEGGLCGHPIRASYKHLCTPCVSSICTQSVRSQNSHITND